MNFQSDETVTCNIYFNILNNCCFLGVINFFMLFSSSNLVFFVFYVLLLLRYVTGGGVFLFLTDTYSMLYQPKLILFSVKALCWNPRVTLFEKKFSLYNFLYFFTKSKPHKKAVLVP